MISYYVTSVYIFMTFKITKSDFVDFMFTSSSSTHVNFSHALLNDKMPNN